MRLKAKEKSKIRKRRKLWSHMGWFWAYKRNRGGRYKTEYTDSEEDSKGIGYFRNNHSLNCGCAICRGRTAYKRLMKRKQRYQNRLKDRELMKVINGHNELD